MWLYEDREAAGAALAALFRERPPEGETIVLALPRGGVPVAAPIAEVLGAALDVYIVRKLGVPQQPELAMGAIASGGALVLNDHVIRQLGISQDALDRVVAAEQHELERREAAYREGRPAPELAGKSVIVVDDGVATGATMRAAVKAIRSLQPARIIVTVPHAPPDTVARLRAEADEVVCPHDPEPYFAVGAWYARFDQTSDEEVTELLRRNRAQLAEAAAR